MSDTTISPSQLKQLQAVASSEAKIYTNLDIQLSAEPGRLVGTMIGLKSGVTVTASMDVTDVDVVDPILNNFPLGRLLSDLNASFKAAGGIELHDPWSQDEPYDHTKHALAHISCTILNHPGDPDMMWAASGQNFSFATPGIMVYGPPSRVKELLHGRVDRSMDLAAKKSFDREDFYGLYIIGMGEAAMPKLKEPVTQPWLRGICNIGRSHVFSYAPGDRSIS